MSRISPRWLIAFAAGAGLWALGAHALWSTTVPASLHLPHLSATRFFSARFLHRSADYERFLDVEAVLADLTVLLVLGLYAWRGHRFTRESAAGRIGTGMLLGMLGFAFVWLAELPFGLVALWWQRRYHVSHQGYLTSAIDSFLSLGGQFLFISLALVVVMGIAGVARRWWWALAAPALVALALLFAFVGPYLIPDTHPLHDRRLLAATRTLERSERVSNTEVLVQDVHRFTTAPNAESTGFGSTRTVILWDTLLDRRFDNAEVRAVIGHELGHLAHHHILKAIGWLALFLIPAAALIARLTRRRGGLASPETVPIALFVLVALHLLTMPLRNVVSRRAEAEADWSALQATREPAAARALFRKLSTSSLAHPDQPTWSYVLDASHPTIMQRIAMTYAWEAAAGERGRGSRRAR
ncbi:MAG TPA: M48 family metalloprotease [Solirubrobacteraceae bacterium]|nr:M48 family metalloprotease [Solirubrobacteraceae bacterium]